MLVAPEYSCMEKLKTIRFEADVSVTDRAKSRASLEHYSKY